MDLVSVSQAGLSSPAAGPDRRTAMALPLRASGPDAILERLAALHPKKIDLSLDRMERLAAALGHPERRLHRRA